VAGQDGGLVVIDASENDQDVYTTLEPDGGYPGGNLSGNCSTMQGEPAFQGSSGGWVTSTFDLTQYQGNLVYLAFVFASDNNIAAGEGWYIDQVTVETAVPGSATCQVTLWPGSVPGTALYDKVGPGTIEVTWGDSCNLGSLPGQAYSIQAGDLDALHAGGTYGHAPVGGLCNYTSPTTISTGAGNEYYLVLPNEGDREGGGGFASNGAPRPATSTVCGERREAACP
jgi:hypothetical protein